MTQPPAAALARRHEDRADGSSWHTLHPGDVAAGSRGDRLETLLGSCVAIVLTDPRRTVGVMCHIVHAGRVLADGMETGACAEVALDSMYGELQSRGIAPRLCEAYVYGGGNMFPSLYRGGGVGDETVRWVLDALAADGIRVIGREVGGTVYRRLAWTIGRDAPVVSAVPV